MRKHSNRDSVLQGNFCDIVNFFRGRDIDDVDRLAQRALTIIMSTDHLVQTGDEANTDPFCANMFASTALGMLNEQLTTYPFVRDPLGGQRAVTIADEDAVFASAEDMIEMAEGLMWPEPTFDETVSTLFEAAFSQEVPPQLEAEADAAASEVMQGRYALPSRRTEILNEGFRPFTVLSEEFPAESPLSFHPNIYAPGKDEFLTREELACWNRTEPADLAADSEALSSPLSDNRRLIAFTDGFKNERE